ncbi:MAG: transporter [Paucimonas sp.]|nr:transporter [Paucimonas sp.]
MHDLPAPRANEAALPSASRLHLCAPAQRPWVLACTILASGMVFMDGTVANVALPALQREFGASAAQVQWVIEAYALLLAALLLAGGAAGDRFGRRLVFALGVVLFSLASLVCGLVGSIEQLIVARAVQGIGGALLVPGSLAIISASFPPELRGKAIGTWSGYSAITAAIGPVVGGFLISHFSWRYAFLLNVPLGALVLALLLKFVPESRNRDAGTRFDWGGALLASLCLGGLVFFLIEGPGQGWGSATMLGAAALALASGAGFIVLERRHPAPLLPFWLFRSRDFSGANLLTLLVYAGLGGALYFLPLNLIQVQGYSATAAGAATLPFVVLMFSLSRWSGGLVAARGARLPLTVGPVVAAIGFFLFSLPGAGGSYWRDWFPAVLVLGLGMAITVAPLTTTVMNAHGEQQAGTASGVNNAVSRVAAALAIALLGLAMNAGFGRALDARIAGLSLSPQLQQEVLAQRGKMGAIAPPAAASPGAATAIREAVGLSFVAGFRIVMWLAAAMCLAGALSAWIMIGAGSVASRPG